MEMMSQEVGKLMEALSKAQQSMEGAVKDSKNPFFKSNYADLNSVWDACKAPLCDNGLSIMQTFAVQDGNQCLMTILGHTSGQWIKSCLLIPITKPDAQSLGSAITYCRRYALAAMVGVCAVDDDAESAMGRNSQAFVKPQQKPLPALASQAKVQSRTMDAPSALSAQERTDVEIESEFYEKYQEIAGEEMLMRYAADKSKEMNKPTLSFMETCLNNDKSFREGYARFCAKQMVLTPEKRSATS